MKAKNHGEENVKKKAPHEHLKKIQYFYKIEHQSNANKTFDTVTKR